MEVCWIHGPLFLMSCNLSSAVWTVSFNKKYKLTPCVLRLKCGLP